MADAKISELTALTAPDAADLLAVVDTSATTTKKTTVAELFASPQPIGATTPATITVPDGSTAAPAIVCTNGGGFRFNASVGDVGIIAGGVNIVRYHVNGFVSMNSTVQLGWSIGDPFAVSGDVFLIRDAAATLAIRNGSSQQTLKIYSTYTDASNYNRGVVTCDSQGLHLANEKAGTGVGDRVILNGTSYVEFRINDVQVGYVDSTSLRATTLVAINTGSEQLTFGAAGGCWHLGRNNATGDLEFRQQDNTLRVTFGYSTTATFNCDLLFSPDATYSIGASGATRPQHLYVSNNGYFGGGLTVGADAVVGNLHLDSHSTLRDVSAGVITLEEYGGGAIGRLNLGGATSSFPAIKRVGATVAFRLADDSGDCNITTGPLITMEGIVFLRALSNGVLRLSTADSDSDFTKLSLGGASSTYPAIKRVGAAVQMRLADDSGFAELAFLLPTSNPGPGTLWNNSGTLTIGT